MMRSTFYLFVLMLLLTTACAENTSNDKVSEAESTALAKEITTIDSTTIEIEKVTEEIEASSKALDELLEEL